MEGGRGSGVRGGGLLRRETDEKDKVSEDAAMLTEEGLGDLAKKTQTRLIRRSCNPLCGVYWWTNTQMGGIRARMTGT